MHGEYPGLCLELDHFQARGDGPKTFSALSFFLEDGSVLQHVKRFQARVRRTLEAQRDVGTKVPSTFTDYNYVQAALSSSCNSDV